MPSHYKSMNKTTNPSMPDKPMPSKYGMSKKSDGSGYPATNPSMPDKPLPKMMENASPNKDQYNTTNPKTGD